MPISMRPLSIRDMFSIGIGPSSSHTVGPMRAGLHFSQLLSMYAVACDSLHVELMGSLGATGRGHVTDKAVALGLAGYDPENVPTAVVRTIEENIEKEGGISVMGRLISFNIARDVEFRPDTILPYHVNALTIRAMNGAETVCERTYYSVGGGFVHIDGMRGKGCGFTQSEECAPLTGATAVHAELPYEYSNATQLLEMCEQSGLRMSELVEANEHALSSANELDDYIRRIWAVMCECIENGCEAEGLLPGVLRVRRRAKALKEELESRPKIPDPLAGMDWVNLFALAVNEENAAGGRVVTAPTNGAAGVIPAVLKYYTCFLAPYCSSECKEAHENGAVKNGAHVRECDECGQAIWRGVRSFLLAATAIGGLIKVHASIAGAEVGCQGEVGSACAMAAAGLAEALGGTPLQVENAAEIAMEHCLGLTCDPVGGLVQIPCIERNAIAAVKAINAARMALWGDGRHVVSLDTVIATMRETGKDMLSKYKETSRGGLAVHVVEC